MFSSTRNPVIMMSRGALRPLHSAFISSRTVAEKKITNANTNKFFSSAKEAAGDAAASAKEAAGGATSFAKRNPFAFQLIIATLKTSAADIMAQTIAEKKSFSEIDWKRNGIFVVFGAAYLGGFQYWIMVNKYRQWFPTMESFAKLSIAQKLKDKAGLIDAAKMILFDIFVHMPWMYFPAYYTCKEFVFGKSWSPIDWVKNGCTNYIGNIKEDLTAMVKLWGPSDCIQFALPMHIRMPFRHLVSFFWTAYVSYTRGSVDDEEPLQRRLTEAQEAVAGEFVKHD